MNPYRQSTFPFYTQHLHYPFVIIFPFPGGPWWSKEFKSPGSATGGGSTHRSVQRAPLKKPSQGQGWERVYRRGLLAPPRTVWGSGTGWRRADARPGRKVREGMEKPRPGPLAPRTGCANGGARAPRGKTHPLAQVKEHPGGPERTTPAAKARNCKLFLKSPVASTSSSWRLPSPWQPVASGAPGDTSGVGLACPKERRAPART